MVSASRNDIIGKYREMLTVMPNVILLNNHVEYVDNGNIAIVGTTLWSHDVRTEKKFQQVTNRWHREDKHWLGVMLSKHTGVVS